MDLRQQKIHSDIGKNHGGKTHDGQNGGAAATPIQRVARMQVSQKDQPGDERPGFLRVPEPQLAEHAVSPKRTGQYAQAQEAEGEKGRPKGD